jgi:hypothetical protein
MNLPRRTTLAILVGSMCLVGVVGMFRWRERHAFFEPSVLLSRFPVEDAVVLNLDVMVLRDAGLLSGSRMALEPEYKQFLDSTGFDYRRDLDLVVASFSKSGNFFIARGRFDWTKLRRHVISQGGSCYEDLCRMQGSTAGRRISFLPLREDTMALAVAADDLAAARLKKPGARVTAQIPPAPVWLSVPGSALRVQGALPPGIRVLLSALTNADRVVVTMAPDKQGIAARMEATCRTQDDARVLASQLRSTTGLLKEALGRDQKARADELARVLVAGRFDQNDRRVDGQWPIGRSLIESLTAGI